MARLGGILEQFGRKMRRLGRSLGFLWRTELRVNDATTHEEELTKNTTLGVLARLSNMLQSKGDVRLRASQLGVDRVGQRRI